MKELHAGHPSLKGTGHTIFLKAVKSPASVKRLLQPASANSKLSAGGAKGTITKGKWKEMPMYSLSLEERQTCPKTCQQWRNCYGNNMPFANRIDHKRKAFLSILEAELSALQSKHPAGFVIRLHVLGDFYSVGYVNFWGRALKRYPGLRIFGYTHRNAATPIGRAIAVLNSTGAWIRWSDAGGPMSANTDTAGKTAEGIHCPEQTGKTAGCTTCGLCWSTPLPIRFSVH
jgi:hypothetical protein